MEEKTRENLNPIGQQPRMLTISYGSIFLEGALNNLLVGLMPLFAANYQRSLGEIALMVSLRNLAALLMAFAAGKLSDRRGRKLPIQLGSLCFFVSFLGLALSPSYGWGLLFATFSGVAYSLVDAPAFSLLMDALTDRASSATGLVQVFFAGGGALISALLAVSLREHMGLWPVYALLLGVTILVFALTWEGDFPPVSGAAGAQSPENVKSPESAHPHFQIQPQAKKEGVWLLAIVLTVSIYLGMMTTWLPTYMETAKGLPQDLALASLSLYQVGAVAGAFFFSWLLRRWHSSRLMFLCPTCAALAFLLLLSQHDPAFLMVCILVMGFFMGTYYSLNVNMAGELFYDRRGSATGAVATVNWLGVTLVAYVGGRLLDSLGIEGAFTFAFAMVLLLIVLALTFHRHYLKLVGQR